MQSTVDDDLPLHRSPRFEFTTNTNISIPAKTYAMGAGNDPLTGAWATNEVLPASKILKTSQINRSQDMGFNDVSEIPLSQQLVPPLVQFGVLPIHFQFCLQITLTRLSMQPATSIYPSVH